jgi:hypothetical protein
MVDHHTLMQDFSDWQAQELKTRGYMPGAQHVWLNGMCISCGFARTRNLQVALIS